MSLQKRSDVKFCRNIEEKRKQKTVHPQMQRDKSLGHKTFESATEEKQMENIFTNKSICIVQLHYFRHSFHTKDTCLQLHIYKRNTYHPFVDAYNFKAENARNVKHIRKHQSLRMKETSYYESKINRSKTKRNMEVNISYYFFSISYVIYKTFIF